MINSHGYEEKSWVSDDCPLGNEVMIHGAGDGIDNGFSGG